jgi:hypothetical protein
MIYPERMQHDTAHNAAQRIETPSFVLQTPVHLDCRFNVFNNITGRGNTMDLQEMVNKRT